MNFILIIESWLLTKERTPRTKHEWRSSFLCAYRHMCHYHEVFTLIHYQPKSKMN